MKHNLTELSDRVMRIIPAFAQRNDATTIGRLAGMASKLQQMQKQLTDIEQEKVHIEESLTKFERQIAGPPIAAPPHPPEMGRRTPRKIRILIDWSRAGKNGETEVICEHKSSDSLAKWATRLYEEMDLEVVEKLTQFRVSRGPLVSRDPARDFKNRVNGEVYQHQPIGDSGCFILTHSETPQKVQDIKNACQFLKLPNGMITVEEMRKNEYPE